MELSCKGIRAIVTAGASGIGRAIVETLVKEGARVHLCDVIPERLTECRNSLPGIGTTLADVSNPAQVDQLFADAKAHLGGLDLLVNNAGIAGPTAPVESISVEDWDRTVVVNISGQFYCARRAVPLIKAAGGGLIVNLSSAAGLFGFPNRTPYAASKWAVIGFTKSLAMELGADKIRVNAICPGLVEGERIDRVISAKAAAENRSVAEVKDLITRQNSLRTFVQAQDIANLIVFLCSPTGRKISGQSLSVDGGTETLRT